MEYIKILKERFSLSSVATLLIGLLLVIYPGFTGKAICYLIAAALIAKGAGSIMARYRNKSLPPPVVFELMGGISTIFIGLFVFVKIIAQRKNNFMRCKFEKVSEYSAYRHWNSPFIKCY